MAADEPRRSEMIELPSSSAEADRPATADAHTRDRWRWLDQVLADRELTPFAFAVAYVIASHVNRETGEAWPSQATIADKVGGKERGVRSAVEQLAACGHLTITTPKGRKGVNHYRPVAKAATASTQVYRHRHAGKAPVHGHGGADETRDHRHGGAGKGPVHRRDHAGKDGLDGHGSAGMDGFHRHDGAGLTGMAMPPNPMREPSETLSSSHPAPVEPRSSTAKPRKPKPKADEAAFDELWQLYPRKVGKDGAVKAYAAAIGRGAMHADVMAGLHRYVAQRAGQDPKFTAHAATWLNAGRWADEEPAGPRRPVALAPSGFEVRGVPVPEANILAAIGRWRRGEPWNDVWGPPPNSPACRVPRPILDRAGIVR